MKRGCELSEWKKGDAMKASNVMFIDQTLGHVLGRRCLSVTELNDIKQKIAHMAQVIFDIPLDALLSSPEYTDINLSDVRIGVKPDLDKIKAAKALGCGRIKICLDFTGLREIPSLAAAVETALKHGMETSVCIINGLDCYGGDMAIFRKLAEEYNLRSYIVDDAESRLDSLNTYQWLVFWRENSSCMLEYNGHNTKGMATGNVLSAIMAGVQSVGVSIGSVGGYPAFEEVLMAMKHLLAMPVKVPDNLASWCRDVMDYAGYTCSLTKAVIGDHIFAHESGIHVDGIVKNSKLYEPFSPESVGLARKIVIGRHSGRASINLKLKQLNIDANQADVPEILAKVRRLALNQKAPVSDAQLRAVIREVAL
ncbi:pyruvate carboxyltransferase [Lucifera butyrica]|uniref:Pyruvate carboxyltransferase n=1 Tax=Lucifera butyrica TaxID=1351585 RepID=A0A498RHJ2_9FIRM|nr:hypothetical protein [Lucifera butyrica]VBB09562.1 pyruvate carboxyltransferase [Lucifera butyrica]